MNGYNFTERVRRVLAMAREEAAHLKHEYVGTEHILLGLIRAGEGVAVAVLQNLGVDLDQVRQNVEAQVKRDKPNRPVGPDLPYTSRAKKVLEFAMTEARELNHSYVGTEHLLLGLIREDKGIAAEVLADMGVTAEGARDEILSLLGADQPARAPSERSDPARRPSEQRTEPTLGARISDRLRGATRGPATPTPPSAASDAWLALTKAEARQAESEAARTELDAEWSHVRGLLDLALRTAAPVRIERLPDGNVWLNVNDGMILARIPRRE